MDAVLFSTDEKIPKQFPSPFSNVPHPIAIAAAEELKATLGTFSEGKMFGILVVLNKDQQLAYLSAYSGMLEKKWTNKNFVPPLFNETEVQSFLSEGEAKLKEIAEQLLKIKNQPNYLSSKRQLKTTIDHKNNALAEIKQQNKYNKIQRDQQRQLSTTTQDDLNQLALASQQEKRHFQKAKKEWNQQIEVLEDKINQLATYIKALRKQRAELSNQLQTRLFSQYQLSNSLGENKNIQTFFSLLPPSGTGDCAAPKLLQYAYQNQLTPIALAEFWWGESPKGSIRHHAQYYPSCRSKCFPILPYMLKGLNLQPSPFDLAPNNDTTQLTTLYEDAYLLVINKPTGLLSTPGKVVEDCVYTRIKKRYPNATGALLVHRLDMSTSGILLIAKTSQIHKLLQKQFLQRTVKKRYIAVLDGVLKQTEGTIELPIRVDLDDRPRQVVCYQYGKQAKTQYRVVSINHQQSRVKFYPITGRTHQLRIHAAHNQGLNIPIVGDELYGKRAERLMLHAEKITFKHPISHKKMTIKSPCPF
jgi:tRNA pseudouridine32 synthase/23S rRNA pseudouridine746 synthase